MNQGKPLKRRARLVARAPLARGELKRGAAAGRLLCGSLREHPAHAWTGHSDDRPYRCPGVRARKALPRARMAASRPAPAVPASVRAALRKRSGGCCEMRLAGCWGQATDPAHRIASGNGGRHGEAKVHHDRLSNVIYACRACHEWSEGHPAKSYELGLMVRDGGVPEVVPVLLLGHSSIRVLLDNEGGWRSTLDGAA